MTKHSPQTSTAHRVRAAARVAPGVHGAAAHPRPLPVIAIEPEDERAPDQPFAEGVHDAIDPDLRYRLISEAAYRRYADRGYEDGYDVDDWLQAETDVDHLLLDRSTQEAHGRGA
jgi:hypothetical protein